MSIINRPQELVKREYELQEPIAVAVEKYATFIQSTDHVVNSALKIVIGETWSSAAGTGPRKRSTLSLVVGAEHHPAGTLRWLGIPEREVFTGVDIVGAVPLKNRIRAKAGVDITSGLRTPDCPQTQAQLIQSNCPSSTKGLNQV